MNGRAVTILAGASVAVLAGTGVLAWWYYETGDAVLSSESLALAQDLLDSAPAAEPGGPARRVLGSRLVKREPYGEGKGLRLFFEVTFERQPARWRGTSISIPSTGTGVFQMEVMYSLIDGNWKALPVQRPRWEQWHYGWSTDIDTGEALWRRLAKEPGKAAEDAMLLTETSSMFYDGVFIFLSALRRTESWKPMAELESRREVRVWAGSTTPEWYRRLAEERRLLKLAPNASE